MWGFLALILDPEPVSLMLNNQFRDSFFCTSDFIQKQRSIFTGARVIQRHVPQTLLSSKDNFIWRKAMVQRLVVVTAKQGEKNLKSMEVRLTGDFLREVGR